MSLTSVDKPAEMMSESSSAQCLPTEMTGNETTVVDKSHSKQNTQLPNGKIKHTDNGIVKDIVKSKILVSDGGNSNCRCECSRVQEVGDSKNIPIVPVLEKNDVDDLDESSLCESVRKVNIEEEEPDLVNGIEYIVYESEKQMPDIMRLITKDLSEPYSIYTYRYFIHNWPKLCFLAMDKEKCVGAIVCKLDMHKKMVRRGYIAMLAVDSDYRRNNIGSHLVLKAIRAMITDDCDEVVLETEITNEPALRLYERLGFVRDKRLFRYYLNGVDALRLKLWLR